VKNEAVGDMAERESCSPEPIAGLQFCRLEAENCSIGNSFETLSCFEEIALLQTGPAISLRENFADCSIKTGFGIYQNSQKERISMWWH
jgi:hypothetical protein